MSIRQIVVLFAIANASCGASDTAEAEARNNPVKQRPSANPHENDAMIFDRVLLDIRGSAPDYRTIVLQRETAAPEEFAGESPQERVASIHRRLLPGLLDSTEKSFWMRNLAADTLQPPAQCRAKNCMSADEFRTRVVDAPDGWRDFFRRFPRSGGLVVLSRPGYSEDGTQALIYVSIACPLCGRGEYLLLSKTDSGEWDITARSVDWLS